MSPTRSCTTRTSEENEKAPHQCIRGVDENLEMFMEKLCWGLRCTGDGELLYKLP